MLEFRKWAKYRRKILNSAKIIIDPLHSRNKRNLKSFDFSWKAKNQITSAINKGLIKPTEGADMMKQVDEAFLVGPMWTTSTEDIVSNVNKGMYSDR